MFWSDFGFVFALGRSCDFGKPLQTGLVNDSNDKKKISLYSCHL